LILVFAEGTILGPRNLWNFFNHKHYFQIGNCVDKITKWQNEQWDITYLTSRKSRNEVNETREILIMNNFPGSVLYYRGKREKYKDIAEDLIPSILIGDDCRSIGGKWKKSISYLCNNGKEKIKSVIVKEFKGMDHLPDSINEPFDYNAIYAQIL
jgi:hypothetical protein